MKRFLLLIILSAMLSIYTPGLIGSVRAVDVITNDNASNNACSNSNATSKPAICSDNQTNSKDNPIIGPNGLVTKGVKILALIVGIAAVVSIIISGIRFILSSGDPNNVNNARQALIYSLVGLIIAAMAQAIASFILNKL